MSKRTETRRLALKEGPSVCLQEEKIKNFKEGGELPSKPPQRRAFLLKGGKAPWFGTGDSGEREKGKEKKECEEDKRATGRKKSRRAALSAERRLLLISAGGGEPTFS